MEIMIMKKAMKNGGVHYLNKNCLKKTTSFEYIDFDDSEVLFTITEDGNEIGEIEACLAPEKAGLQIVRFKSNIKDLNKKEEILKNIINYIWNYSNMNQLVLAIHINYEGSGVDCYNLEHLGFVGRNNLGSKLYTLLNPNYINLIEKYAEDKEAIQELSKYYDSYQKRKERQLSRIKRNLENIKMFLKEKEDALDLKNRKKYHEECIESLQTSKRKI